MEGLRCGDIRLGEWSGTERIFGGRKILELPEQFATMVSVSVLSHGCGVRVVPSQQSD